MLGASIMKIALDPYMHRHVPLLELPRFVAELGYEYIELSPRADFLNWWVHPRVFPERIKAFKRALKDAGVKLATLLPMYRWASPIEAERQTAVKNWKAAIQVAVEMGCDTMNSEFGRGPSPDVPSHCTCCAGAFTEACEAAWFRSMEELVPILEKEGIQLNIEPHPEDFVETLQPAVDMIRVINSKNVRFLYCAPHTFYFGDDIQAMIREAAPVLAHVHIADTFNHKASSGLRYIINPPGSKATVHQHLDIGQGEVDWDVFFGTLHEVGFDGIMTACVFAWEEKAEESSRFMLKEIQRYVDKYWGAAPRDRRHDGGNRQAWQTVNVGVIGVGMIGQDHIRRLTKVLAGSCRGRRDATSTQSRAQGVADGDRQRACIRDRRGADRRLRGRRGRRHLLGADPRAVRAGLHRGRQARVLREAAGDDAGSLPAHPRRRDGVRPAAGPGRLHAPLRRRLPRDEGGRGQRRHRRAADDARARIAIPIGARALHQRHGDQRHRGARRRCRPLAARRRGRRDLGPHAAPQPPRRRPARSDLRAVRDGAAAPSSTSRSR